MQTAVSSQIRIDFYPLFSPMAKEQAYHFKQRTEGRLILCLGKGQELNKRSIRRPTLS